MSCLFTANLSPLTSVTELVTSIAHIHWYLILGLKAGYSQCPDFFAEDECDYSWTQG